MYHADGESRTTFDAILEGRGLAGRDPALDLMAEILNDGRFGFRRGEAMRHPEGAGIRALNRGLEESVPNDRTRLDHLMVVYDALYQYCRQEAAGT